MVGTSYEFEFCLPNISNISNLRFRSTEKYIHLVWNQENADKGIYLSSSSDSGKSFTPPKKVIETQGEVKDVQIIARDEDIVITIIENVSSRDYLRAATGMIKNDLTHTFKPCEKVEINGEIINVYTTFTEDASEDHVYLKIEVIERDGRVCIKIRKEVYIHCSRFSLHQLL
jgi:hypothetical protein